MYPNTNVRDLQKKVCKLSNCLKNISIYELHAKTVAVIALTTAVRVVASVKSLEFRVKLIEMGSLVVVAGIDVKIQTDRLALTTKQCKSTIEKF